MAETKKTAVAKPAAKAVAAKAADTKKEEVKVEAAVKEAPKAEAKKPAAKKAPAKKAAEKKPAAEKAAPKARGKKAEVKQEVHLQFAGKSYSTEDLQNKAADIWKYDLKKEGEAYTSLELYVKSEESTVYYVFNGDITGSFFI